MSGHDGNPSWFKLPVIQSLSVISVSMKKRVDDDLIWKVVSGWLSPVLNLVPATEFSPTNGSSSPEGRSLQWVSTWPINLPFPLPSEQAWAHLLTQNTHESPGHFSVGPPRTGVNQATPDSGASMAEIPLPHQWPVERLRWCLANRSRVLRAGLWRFLLPLVLPLLSISLCAVMWTASTTLSRLWELIWATSPCLPKVWSKKFWNS